MLGRGWREGTVVLAGAAVLAVAMTWPVALRLGSVGRVDTGDGQFSIWVVSWVARTVVADPAHLYDANIFYPRRGTYAYSETFFVPGLLAVPGYWLTRNPHVAHNSSLLLCLALAFVGVYYLVRYLTHSRPAAVVAAVLFAFCPYVFARTAHIHLMMTAGLPFTLLAFHRLVDRPGPWRALGLGSALWVAAMSAGYYGVFAGLVCAGGSLFYLVSRACWREWRYYLWLGVAAFVGIGLVLPFFLPFIALSAEAGPLRTLDEARKWSADWRAYLASAGMGHRWMLPQIKPWPEVLFPGFLATVLGAAGLFLGVTTARRERGDVAASGAIGAGTPAMAETTLFYTLVAVFSVWFSLGPDSGLYSLLYRHVAVFSFLRAPARMGLLVTLSLTVLSGIALQRLLAKRRHAAWIAAALVAVALVELNQLPLLFREVQPVSRVYDVLSMLPRGGVAEFPFFFRSIDFHRHTYYMLNSTRHWQPLINGYSDYIPPGFKAIVNEMNSFPSPVAFRLLREHNARYVVVHRNFYHHRSLPGVLDGLSRYREHLRPVAEDANNLLFEIVSWPE